MKRLIVSASLLLLFVSLSAFAKEKKSAAQAGVNTDQAIIVGSLILGFWFIGKSIYLIVT